MRQQRQKIKESRDIIAKRTEENRERVGEEDKTRESTGRNERQEGRRREGKSSERTRKEMRRPNKGEGKQSNELRQIVTAEKLGMTCRPSATYDVDIR